MYRMSKTPQPVARKSPAAARGRRIRVGSSGVHGKGVFAARPIAAGEHIVEYRGKVIPNGLDLWHFDSDFFKTWVHGRLSWPEDQPGGFHLHQTTSEDYCQQLVAEQRITRPSGQVTWVRVKRDNHYLDCEALNALAAHIVGVHSLPRERPEPQAAPRPHRARMISPGMR